MSRRVRAFKIGGAARNRTVFTLFYRQDQMPTCTLPQNVFCDNINFSKNFFLVDYGYILSGFFPIVNNFFVKPSFLFIFLFIQPVVPFPAEIPFCITTFLATFSCHIRPAFVSCFMIVVVIHNHVLSWRAWGENLTLIHLNIGVP